MSFRLFVYYCAVCGGWAALVGWAAGHFTAPSNMLASDGIHGLMLGLFVALGLGLVDSIWNVGSRLGVVLARALVAVFVGAVGGLLGGILGHLLYLATLNNIFKVIGWGLTGLLIGASIATFELVTGLLSGTNLKGARQKLLKCLFGGVLGGLGGGLVATLLLTLWSAGLSGPAAAPLWSPTALGFVALGMCIGLLVGLAQVILKEAWIKIEAGFRPGRELILSKERTRIGRAESSDIPLYGDPAVEKQHAVILVEGDQYFLENGAVPGGTYVNDEPVKRRVALRSGDLIRVGKSALRFYERKNTANSFFG